MCFRTFEDDLREQTDLEWVECACSRCLHEECIDYDITQNEDGVEMLCLFVKPLIAKLRPFMYIFLF